MRSTSWDSSAFMWSYDDWGGWFDHVKPPKVDRWGLGFRAPALLVSPYARRGHIQSNTLDFTSELRFIEDNWGLKPLAKRDREAGSIMPAFDFNAAPRPPEFVAAVRDVPAEKQPRRTIVYIAYGLAVILALGAIGLALASERRRKRRRGGPPATGPDEKPRPKVTA
jgi:phospholipase C